MLRAVILLSLLPLLTPDMWAAGPALASAAAISTLVANTDAVLHPLVTGRKIRANAKRIATLGRKNDGKLHDLQGSPLHPSIEAPMPIDRLPITVHCRLTPDGFCTPSSYDLPVPKAVTP